VVIQAAALEGDFVRAERYMRLADEHGQRPPRESFAKLIRALLEKGEPRRAHCWLQVFVQHGCEKSPDYLPKTVRAELRLLRSQRAWSAEDHFQLVTAVAVGLAGIGNTDAANGWLGYLVDCGVRPHDFPETWERVRAATPLAIVPASLFSDEQDYRPPAPVALLPAALRGEEHNAEGSVIESPSRTRRSLMNSQRDQASLMLTTESESPRTFAQNCAQGPPPTSLEWATKDAPRASPALTASTRCTSSAGPTWAAPRSSTAGGGLQPRGTRTRTASSVSSAGTRTTPKALTGGTSALCRLLEAKHSLAAANRAAMARLGPPLTPSTPSGRLGQR